MALTGLAAVMQRPMSVAQVVKEASEETFDPWYPPKNWFRTAEHLFKQGSVYLREKNLQPAYFMLYRQVSLITNQLPTHPQAKDPEYKKNWATARRDASKSITILEEIKPKINSSYERYLLKRKEAKEKARREKKEEQAALDEIRGDDGSAQVLDPVEHSELGIRMANARTGRRRRRRGSSPVYGTQRDGEDLDAMMRHTRVQIDRNAAASNLDSTSPRMSKSASSYHYPSVQHHNYRTPSPDRYSNQGPPSSSAHSSATARSAICAPPIPPKHLEDFISPPRPPKSGPSPPPLPAKAPSQDAPPLPFQPPSMVPRPMTPGPALDQFRTTSTLESGSPLRTLFLPTDLRHSFLSLAAANTARNLETLGLLCGHLIRNALFVTALLLPPQTSTSDTCEMTDVGEVMVDEYISAHGAPDPEPTDSDDEDADERKADRDEYATSAGGDMIILGWIHTHPSQTCFLSSRDLHTHVWYQSGLPESIALVCAPSKSPGLGSGWNAFRLTDPPGMGTVRSCKKSGVFHPHERDDIYTDVVGGKGEVGHVREVKALEYKVVDLRDE